METGRKDGSKTQSLARDKFISEVNLSRLERTTYTEEKEEGVEIWRERGKKGNC